MWQTIKKIITKRDSTNRVDLVEHYLEESRSDLTTKSTEIKACSKDLT
jgi:hypothetical protein